MLEAVDKRFMWITQRQWVPPLCHQCTVNLVAAIIYKLYVLSRKLSSSSAVSMWCNHHSADNEYSDQGNIPGISHCCIWLHPSIHNHRKSNMLIEKSHMIASISISCMAIVHPSSTIWKYCLYDWWLWHGNTQTKHHVANGTRQPIRPIYPIHSIPYTNTISIYP